MDSLAEIAKSNEACLSDDYAALIVEFAQHGEPSR